MAFWNWDWFIPIVQSRALAAIGRPVTIAHLHVRLGRVVTVIADGVVVANPPDWPSDDPPFVSIRSLTIEADAWGYVRGHVCSQSSRFLRDDRHGRTGVGAALYSNNISERHLRPSVIFRKVSNGFRCE